jgi:uncharacterized protein (TIGR02231 family)
MKGDSMKKLLVVAVLVFAWLSPCLAQESIPSSIKEVTVYTSGALVKREASAKVGKGIHELFVDVQAFDLDRDSLTARILGEGEIQGVQYREVPTAESPQEGVRRAEQKLKKLKEAKRQLLDEKGVLDKKELFLTSLIKSPVSPPATENRIALPRVQDLDQMLGFLGTSLKGINEKRQPLDARIEDLEKEIAAAERELAGLKGQGQAKRKVIDVTFDSRKEQTIRIEASYLVRSASWKPLYKASVAPDLKAADLTMFSTVAQKSGEDWKEVVLSISNAIPLKGAALPEAWSWYLDYPRRAKMEARFDLAAPAPAPARAEQKAMAVEQEADVASAERSETPLSIEYRLPSRVTVESGTRDGSFPLFSRPLVGEFSYYAAPRANPLAFLICNAKADKELLAGPLNAYFGGRFVGKTLVTEKRVGEDFLVNLGADREVKVRREKVRDKVKETSWGKNAVRDIAYRIDVENLRSRAVKIKIVDAVPVPKTDRIEVKDLKVSPEASDKAYEGREGVRAWDLEVAPGAKREIAVEFTVTYPKDAPPPGL